MHLTLLSMSFRKELKSLWLYMADLSIKLLTILLAQLLFLLCCYYMFTFFQLLILEPSFCSSGKAWKTKAFLQVSGKGGVGKSILGKLHRVLFSSIQFSHSVVSDSLRPHESQHTRPPCPSPTSGVHSDSCPSSRWCHPAISSCRTLLLLPPNPPSIRVFSNESALRIRWPKYWSFSFSFSPSNEHPGLIFFRMD